MPYARFHFYGFRNLLKSIRNSELFSILYSCGAPLPRSSGVGRGRRGASAEPVSVCACACAWREPSLSSPSERRAPYNVTVSIPAAPTLCAAKPDRK